MCQRGDPWPLARSRTASSPVLVPGPDPRPGRRSANGRFGNGQSPPLSVAADGSLCWRRFRFLGFDRLRAADHHIGRSVRMPWQGRTSGQVVANRNRSLRAPSLLSYVNKITLHSDGQFKTLNNPMVGFVTFGRRRWGPPARGLGRATPCTTLPPRPPGLAMPCHPKPKVGFLGAWHALILCAR